MVNVVQMTLHLSSVTEVCVTQVCPDKVRQSCLAVIQCLLNQ